MAYTVVIVLWCNGIRRANVMPMTAEELAQHPAWSRIKAMPIGPRYRLRQQRALAAQDQLLKAGFALDSADKIAMVAVLEAVLANPASTAQELAEPFGRSATWFNDTLQRTCEVAGV